MGYDTTTGRPLQVRTFTFIVVSKIHAQTPSFISHHRALRRKPDEPLLDPTRTFLLCPTYPTHPVSKHPKPDARRQDAGERRTFMGHVQVAAHGEPVLDARKYLEKVARLVAHQDVFCTTSRLERERQVFLCRTILKKGGGGEGARVSSTVRVCKATPLTRAGKEEGTCGGGVSPTR